MENYSIEEILIAVDELQSFKKDKSTKLIESKPQPSNLDIPVNTLKLIEEAEKNKN